MIPRWSLAALSWLVLFGVCVVAIEDARIQNEVAAMLERDGLVESGRR